MATACWAFIVATRTPLKTAPLLDFSSLQAANRESYKQLVNKCLWSNWGQILAGNFVAETG
jgi:hypothetical protein